VGFADTWILAGAADESKKLMQNKLIVYNSKKEFESYQEEAKS